MNFFLQRLEAFWAWRRGGDCITLPSAAAPATLRNASKCHSWHNVPDSGDSMPTDFPMLDDLPRQTASDVKNKWRQVVREVREAGSVAITNHSSVEVVLVNAEAYRQLAASAAALKERDASALAQLSAQFNERLASLQAPGAGKKAAAVFQRRGRLATRPKAGPAF